MTQLTLTQQFMQSKSPWDNHYQGQDKRVLFVCTAGILRSATAARIYASKYNTRACGSAYYALIPISSDLILWANEIVFADLENKEEAESTYELPSDKIKVLNIPDQYPYMDDRLILEFSKQYEAL